jgi:hypothetical protein
MKQPTHAWIAIRAIALLEDSKKSPELVELLKPHVYEAAVGAWMPDLTDDKRAGGVLGNHVFKIVPYTEETQKDRFIVKRDDLIKRIGTDRLVAKFIRESDVLDDKWWNKSYKAEASRGQHLPNRVMALSTMLKDLLIVGDQELDNLLPSDFKYIKKEVKPGACTPHEAAAMYFFMISHFIADITMPCHCDGRELAGYTNGLLHEPWELHWDDIVGKEFIKKRFLNGLFNKKEILEKARLIDTKFDIDFSTRDTIPDFIDKNDAWLEAMFLCRASFAVASIIAPCGTYPYDNTVKQLPYANVFGQGKERLLKTVDQAVMHDAVLNTAIFWKNIWDTMAKP